jgi:hypothetical protein
MPEFSSSVGKLQGSAVNPKPKIGIPVLVGVFRGDSRSRLCCSWEAPGFLMGKNMQI